MTNLQIALTILTIALVTLFTRSIAFALFPANRPVPPYVTYLGKVLPYAVMGMLVVYCLKDATPLAYPYALPELLACAAVVALHLWRHNSLLSIGGGTVFYMILVQHVFVR